MAALPCEPVGLLGSALALRLVELRAARLWELPRLALELKGLEALLAGLDASCSSCNNRYLRIECCFVELLKLITFATMTGP